MKALTERVEAETDDGPSPTLVPAKAEETKEGDAKREDEAVEVSMERVEAVTEEGPSPTLVPAKAGETKEGDAKRED